MNCTAALRRRVVATVQNRILSSIFFTRATVGCYALPRSANQHFVRTISAQPKVFPAVGFETIPPDEPIEEEDLLNYKAERYYPVTIGQILHERYQITGKLGFGGGSTVWVCRDLRCVRDGVCRDSSIDAAAALERIHY